MAKFPFPKKSKSMGMGPAGPPNMGAASGPQIPDPGAPKVPILQPGERLKSARPKDLKTRTKMPRSMMPRLKGLGGIK